MELSPQFWAFWLKLLDWHYFILFVYSKVYMVEKKNKAIKGKSYLIRQDCCFFSHASSHWLPLMLNFRKQSWDISVGRKSRSIIKLKSVSVSLAEVKECSSNGAVLPCSCEGIYYACGQICYRSKYLWDSVMQLPLLFLWDLLCLL